MISTSILNLEQIENLPKLEKAGSDYIHLDVMDGKFVTNKKDYSLFSHQKPIDIHLMVKNVKYYVDQYKKFMPQYITFHIEVGNTQEYINYIKKQNIKVGIAINPNTPLSALKPYLNQIDLVLVMSVFPGYGGQEFIDVTDKIKQVKDSQKNNHYLIEVDGGINDVTIEKVKDCDLIVCGSFITKSEDYQSKIEILKNKMK